LTPTFGVVNNFGTNAGNNVIGFQGVESIITENQDPTLTDNALGYSNENAPGAHRLKIVPTLVSFDPANTTQANTYANDFNPIATYNTGNMVTKSFASANLYSIVGEAIAKRVYEESGNYVVNPFAVDSVSDRGDGSTPSLGANGVFGGGDDTRHSTTLTATPNLSPPLPALVSQNWISIDIPFSAMPGLLSRSKLAQLILEGGDGSVIYVDNIYFYN
jgi:hypothetical protein